MPGRVDICTADYAAAIKEALLAAGLGDAHLFIVQSVQDWARDHGIRESNPFRAGLAARAQDDTPAVVLLSILSTEIQQSVVPALEMRGFSEDTTRLEAPGAFLEHLVLHEIAHLVLGVGATESECDSWAFTRMTGVWRKDAA